MDITITSGNLEVLHSGSIIQIKDEPINITLTGKTETPLNFVFIFKDDKNDKETVTNYNLIDEFTLEITFINFNSSLGTGNTDLIDLGSIDNRKLFFNYRIYSIKNLGKTLHYSFYIGEEVKNG